MNCSYEKHIFQWFPYDRIFHFFSPLLLGNMPTLTKPFTWMNKIFTTGDEKWKTLVLLSFITTYLVVQQSFATIVTTYIVRLTKVSGTESFSRSPCMDPWISFFCFNDSNPVRHISLKHSMWFPDAIFHRSGTFLVQIWTRFWSFRAYFSMLLS